MYAGGKGKGKAGVARGMQYQTTAVLKNRAYDKTEHIVLLSSELAQIGTEILGRQIREQATVAERTTSTSVIECAGACENKCRALKQSLGAGANGKGGAKGQN